MALSKVTSQQIIDIVSADPYCRAIIYNPFHQNGKLLIDYIMRVLIPQQVGEAIENKGLAGWLRNLALEINLMEGKIDIKIYNELLCGGIASAAWGVLSRNKQKIKGLKDINGIGREIDGWAHHAIVIKMQDQSEYVFDWHKTLNIKNPFISKKSDWLKGINEIPYLNFKGFS